ncbi:hypothetical protein AWC05_19160 [Mycobacterium florentinum]|uniref:Glutathione synthase n=1 Tax=Mycobacterium florentinum TaxID=292462 RepID=A0A1X1UAI6_MYCFL|nr:hypothetical protein [Mycobacterium florentinum]MCV7408018.1 hypothetical protein [Mycobacterium florentinum]ORV53842.1 hypothetical protein AWC05_19160 [Mycobacterium florentinum]BBX77348.1 hypothetical protein MFLOJ_11350 [Mycobacterium florentinum]
MKLARPDVFHPRIVLAGCPRHPDDAGLVPALRRRGLHARWLSWDDPETVGADLVILRDAADAADRRDEFLAWTTRVKNLLNPPAVVAWNLGAHYLDDIEKAGVPTQPGAAQSVLIFLGGRQSHAWPAEPDFEVWELGCAAIASAAQRAGVGPGDLLYARVDINGERVAGLDLIAPSLGWRRLDSGARELAQREFALAVESACERLGLGPLSHRRP